MLYTKKDNLLLHFFCVGIGSSSHKWLESVIKYVGYLSRLHTPTFVECEFRYPQLC